MDAWSALLGAVIGASAAIGSGLALEAYKRHRDRRGLASALAGEIAAMLALIEKRQYVRKFGELAAKLEEGNDIPVPKVVGDPPMELDPVARASLDRLGLLAGDLPERTIKFYTFLRGIRLDLSRVAGPEFEGQPARKAALLREDVRIWTEEISPVITGLVDDLRCEARRPWRPWRRS